MEAMDLLKTLLIFGLCAICTSGREIPELDFMPRPDFDYPTDAFLRIVSGHRESYGPLRDRLKADLDREYSLENIDPNTMYDCGVYTIRPPTFVNDEVCVFRVDLLGPCVPENDYGFLRGRPCIFLRLGRLPGWKPQNNSRVNVECHGMYPPDKDNIGPLEYYPTPYMDAKYFPFKNQENYMSPLVAVRFRDIAPGVIVFVECTARDQGGEVGRTRLEMLVE